MTQPPRRSSARERQARRQVDSPYAARPSARRSPQAERNPARAVPRRAAAPRLPVGLYVIGSVIFVAALVVGLGLLRNNEAEVPRNALWLGSDWTHADQDDASVGALVERLRENRIGTVYAWVSVLQPEGNWNSAERFTQVEDFVRRFNAAYPEASLYGWISVASDQPEYRLDQPDLQQTVADFSGRLVTDFGFDGVALNVVPVLDADENYLSLVRRVRQTVGNDAQIALAVPPDWTPVAANIPQPPQIAPNTVWSDAYKQSVTLLADEVVLTTYNTGLPSAEAYSEWIAYQVQAFAAAAADVDGTRLIIGVPTYEGEPPLHDPQVENIASAVAGIRRGIDAAGEAAQFVQGVAIYADWDTDDSEWAQFRGAWLGS